jgi:uncharacterized protein YecT (DUF1311 family)
MPIFLLPLAGMAAIVAGASGQMDYPKSNPAVEVREPCANIDPWTERRCIGARVEKKEGLLAQAFVRARAVVAQGYALYGHSDIRTDPKYLDESQAAWKSYVDANCTVVAALGGGSNSAISDREGACYEKELDLRIAFLREVEDESSR